MKIYGIDTGPIFFIFLMYLKHVRNKVASSGIFDIHHYKRVIQAIDSSCYAYLMLQLNDE